MHMSVRSKCDIERLKQIRVAERLEQARHGTLFERLQTDGLVSLSGDEEDRNLLPASFDSFGVQVRSYLAWRCRESGTASGRWSRTREMLPPS